MAASAERAREQRTLGVVIHRAILTYKRACEAEGLDDAGRAAALPITVGRSAGVPADGA